MKGRVYMIIKEGQQSFYIGDDEENAIGRITYEVESDDVIVANHTYVSPVHRGKNIAKLLLDQLVEHARDNNLKVRPQCSYVVRAFEKYKEYQDIIA